MQGKLFQKCTHLLYCNVLSLGGNVNTRRMLQPDMGSIFHIKKSMKYSGHRKLLCELSKLSNLVLLTSSDTKRTLMHLFLFTNSAQRELVQYVRRVYTTAISFPLHPWVRQEITISGQIIGQAQEITISGQSIGQVGNNNFLAKHWLGKK